MKPVNYILLIDDDESTNFYNKIILEDNKVTHKIKVAKNGEEALEILETDKKNGTNPDVIFLDINMPVMNGFEFLDIYEQWPEEYRSKVLIVMLTTSLHEMDIEKSKNYESITEFKNKPITPELLNEIWDKYF